MLQPRILVIDPSGAAALPYPKLVARLQPLKLQIEPTLRAGIAAMGRDAWDCAVVTMRNGGSADAFVTEIRTAEPGLPIVVIDDSPTVDAARACLRHGGCDYLELCRVDADLEASLARLLAASRRLDAEKVLRRVVERPYSFEGFLGTSPAMQTVYSMIERVGPSNVDVLITGETGTGKELVARAVHQQSRRATAAFVPVDCGAIPDGLLESELFGHERGAFTGADARHMGLIEFADGGTLFLDEIGELQPALQAKLLRVLQERRIRRVGARQETSVDVRLIAATSRPIDEMVARGEFRRDLFYRINVVRIDLPPLRDRGDDIGLLAEFFAHRAAQEMEKTVGGLSIDAYQVLRGYHWPGNVRELQNAVRRAVAMTRSTMAGVEDLPDEIVAAAGRQQATDLASDGFFAQRAEHMARYERQFLSDLLARHEGDVSAAAREARIPRGTLYRLMKSHALEAAAFRR